MTRIVASLSGGKDSTALALWLMEQGFDFEPVFMDTGWEAPQTYDYLDHLESHVLRHPITRLSGERQMVELVLWKGMFPSSACRFCTQNLKVLPFLEYVGEDEITNCVGIRAEESNARAKLEEHGVLDDGYPNIRVWRPLLRWDTQSVIDAHGRHGLAPNPLYLSGAERVGCWPCVFENKADVRLVANTDPGRIDLIRELERILQGRQEKRLAARGETREGRGFRLPTWFTLRDGSRKRTSAPIDEVVAWSRTGHGGRQFMIDHEDGRRGCLRWGLCDA